MNPSDVYVLIPTCHRPAGLRRVLDSLALTAPEAGIIVATDPTDEQARAICARYGVPTVTNQADYCGGNRGWNNALRAAPRSAKAFVLGADDIEFLPRWLDETLDVLKTRLDDSGLAGLNDGKERHWQGYYYYGHYLMTRDFIVKYNGGVMAIERYFHCGTDNESCIRAMWHGKLAFAFGAAITHHWYGYGPDADKAYRVVQAHKQEARDLLAMRYKLGFPDDFEPIITE